MRLTLSLFRIMRRELRLSFSSSLSQGAIKGRPEAVVLNGASGSIYMTSTEGQGVWGHNWVIKCPLMGIINLI